MNAAFTKSLSQSPQQVKPTNTTLHSEQDVRLLEVGKPFEREMKGGETHTYLLTLAVGQFLHAVVDQRGIDVVVMLYDPDGKQIFQLDSPNGTQGPEQVWAIAKASGGYRLEVHSPDKEVLPGRYEISIKELRVAAQQDRSRVDGELAFMEAEILRAQGDAASLRQAIVKYEESLLVWREIGYRSGEAATLHSIGYVYNSLGEAQKALDYYNQTLLLNRALGDRSGEARTLNNIGLAYFLLGEQQKALGYFNQALPLRQAVGDRSGEATTLNNIGAIHYSLGDRQKALDYYNQALPISQAIGDRSGEATTLNNIGRVYDDLGNRQKALEYFNKALPIFRALGSRLDEVTALNNLGRLYDDFGDKQKAIAYYNQALPISQAIGDRSGEARTLNNVGLVYFSLGERQKALEYFNQALPLRRAAKDRPGEARTLNNIGATYNSLGEKQKALDYYNQSLLINQTLGDGSDEAPTLNNLGKVYNSLGEKQKALDYYHKVLSLSRIMANRPLEGNALNDIGEVYDDLGDRQKALDYYNQALLIRRTLEDRSGEAVTLNNIGLVYNDLGDKQKALEYYNQALPLSRAVGNRPQDGVTLHNIGYAYSLLGEKQKALEFYNQALLISREISDRLGEAATLSNSGFVYELLGEKQKALDIYQQAIAQVEDLRASATIEEIKTGLAGESASAYVRASSLLMSMQQQSKAFNLTERARARTFLDQLGSVRLNTRKSANAQLIQEERASRSALAWLEASLRQEHAKPQPSRNTDVISSIETQLAVKRREYEILLTRLKLTNPEYASLRSVNTLTLPEVQKSLSKDTTLLSYFVTPEKTFVFVITQGSFRSVEIPVKGAELKDSINWFRDFASLRNPRPESLTRLHNWLIAPIQTYIHTPVIGIIPHGILNYLPFAALTDGQHYFGDEHTLFYLPSASVLPFIKKKSRPVGNQILVLAQSQAEGFSTLLYAEKEAESVADLFGTKAFIKRDASKSDFLKRAGDYSILHMAAHAELNTSSPLFSRIMLRADKDGPGALEVREIYDLDLSKSSLVVLSACETQLGAQSQGDDIVGLNRAFIYAGAPTVIASLWTVDDESTSYLMKAFYTRLKRGLSKAEALQAAQSDTRKKYPHPYYWAGFVLTGDPGPTTSSRAGRN